MSLDLKHVLICAKLSQIAYIDKNPDQREAQVKALGLDYIMYATEPLHDARVMVVAEGPRRYVIYSGTEFSECELPSIESNFDDDLAVLPGGARVHRGYLTQVESLVGIIRTLNLTGPVTVTGHSMGGADGSLLVNVYNIGDELITFGAPKCGDAMFWSRARVQPTNIVREQDPAPIWPFLSRTLIRPPHDQWWLHNGSVQQTDSRPMDEDAFIVDWPDHAIERYVSDVESLLVVS